MLDYVYSDDFGNGSLPSEIRTYNTRGKLINLIDNKTGKEYDENGNEIVYDNEKYDSAIEAKQEENYRKHKEIIAELHENFTTENLRKINSDNVMVKDKYSKSNVLSSFYNETSSFDENGELVGTSLLDRILSNPDSEVRKEQLSIIIEAFRGAIKTNIENNGFLKSDQLQKGEQMLNQLLDDCLKPGVSDNQIKNNIEKVVLMLENPHYEFTGFVHQDIPNGKVDKYNYQNKLGDCWLLSTLDSISEIKGGQKYLEQFIDINNKKQEITINLNGGKVQYTIPFEEIQNGYQYSVGDADMKAFEMAFDKYYKEFEPNGVKTIGNGDWMKNAFALLSGNEPVEAVIQNGKVGILQNNEFIELNKKNRDKLKYIPIDIKNITPQILNQIKEIQEFTAKTTVSSTKNIAHAYYITNISPQGHITVKEPNNPTNSRTYVQNYYLNLYNDMTIFII